MNDWFSGRRFVVIGGCGFLGSHLVTSLLDHDAHVVVMDNLSRGNYQVSHQNVEYHLLDASDVESCERIYGHNIAVSMGGIKTYGVFNLAAAVAGVKYNIDHHLEMFSKNISLMTAPVVAAANVGIEHFVQVSSVCIYSDEYNHPSREQDAGKGKPNAANYGYGMAKRAGEDAVLMAGLPHAVIARPSNMYGPHDYFDEKAHVIPALIRKAITNPVLEVSSPPNISREFLYVKDCAEALMHLMIHGESNQAYNVGCDGDNVVTLKELAEKILVALDNPDKEIRFDRDAEPGDHERWSDCSEINGVGWRHKTSLSDGLSETIAWLDTAPMK